MILKTRVFHLHFSKYKNLSELAQAMEISVSQVYRVLEGKRNINRKFIIGAMKAFPGYKFDDLFYFVPEAPVGRMSKTTVTENRHEQSSADEAAKEEQRMKSAQQAVEKFTSATDEYAQHLKSHISALVSLSEASQELKRGAAEASKLLSCLVGSLVN